MLKNKIKLLSIISAINTTLVIIFTLNFLVTHKDQLTNGEMFCILLLGITSSLYWTNNKIGDEND